LKAEIENFKKIGWMIELLTKEAMIKKQIYWVELFKKCESNMEWNEEMNLT
jgi:hypothetical protein